MATGGRFSAALVAGSEEIYEFCCTPCSKVDDIVEAVNQCLDCGEFFCVKCIDFHKKFGAFSGHKVLGRSEMRKTTASKARKPLPPPQRCQAHGGERMTVYCADHDVVCCNTGISIKHKNCDGTTYIADAAVGIKTGKQIQTTKSSVSSILNEVKREKSSRQKELEDLDKYETETIEQTEDYAERLVKRIRELKQNSIEKIKTKHNELKAGLSGEVATLDDVVLTLEADMQKPDSSPGNYESQVFVDVKLSKDHEVEGREHLQQLTPIRKPILKYMMKTNIEHAFEGTDSLGSFVDENRVYTARLRGIYDVKLKPEKHTCVIEGACLLPNGSLIITDFSNKRIKRLDDSYKVADYCDMPGEPWGVTCTASDEVAVTLRDQKKVQFVSVHASMSTTRSFRTSDCCRAILYSGGELFMSCGGHPNKSRGEGLGHVSVHSVRGDLVRTIHTDQSGQQIFNIPLHICSSRNNNSIFTTDAGDRFRSFNRDGSLVNTITSPSLRCAYGVCTLDNDHVLVGGYSSNNVLQFDGDGRKMTELLKDTDGIKTPQALCYDSRNSRLIITMEASDYIKVFDLI